MLRRILSTLALNNDRLFILCTALSVIAFAAVYAAIYFLTAKTYYKIVAE